MTRWCWTGVLLLAGCGEVASPRAPVATVVVTPDSAIVVAPGTLLLQATLLDTAGRPLSGRTVAWSSSDPYRASVSGSGLVTGVGHGRVTITAAVERHSGTATIDVYSPVVSVTVDQGDQTIVVTGWIELSATARDWRGLPLADRVVSWSSSDPATADVTPAGRVTGRAPGGASITATSEAQAGSITIAVATLSFRDLSAGWSGQTCGVVTSGAVFCWGSDAYGQLGNGPGGDSPTPISTWGGLDFAAATTGGRFTCGVVAGAGAYCWGNGSRGRLGHGSLADSPVPAPVSGPSFLALSTGYSHACALDEDGAVYCWGDNGTGQLGTDAVKLSTTPRRVPGDWLFAAVSAGDGFTCGLALGGRAGGGGDAYCWGNNQAGQLGSAGPLMSTVPLHVAGEAAFATLDAGTRHSCALTPTGAAYCWGDNRSGELGDGSTRSSAAPVPVAGGLAFRAISAGQDFTCAVAVDGTGYCWGDNSGGQLGHPAAESCDGLPCSTTPQAVSTEHRFAVVTAGGGHACALATDGLAYCWGRNSYGQLGDGTATDRAGPVRVVGQQ